MNPKGYVATTWTCGHCGTEEMIAGSNIATPPTGWSTLTLHIHDAPAPELADLGALLCRVCGRDAARFCEQAPVAMDSPK